MSKYSMRVLYFSNMTVSPGSGGGNTVINLLEPCPAEGEVFYSTPNAYPSHWEPFPEISSRICWFSTPNRHFFPTLPRGRRFKVVQGFNKLIVTLNDKVEKEIAVKQIIRCVQQLGIDVLLLCPQGMIDVSAELVEQTGLPTIVWFMDNYYEDQSAISCVRKIWEKSQWRFVISEAMQKYFSEFYGGSCEVLNNSVPFSENFPVPPTRTSSRLRLVYAGAMHSYYLDSMSMVLNELRGLHNELELDIYSHENFSSKFKSAIDFPYRQLPPIPANELRERLKEYDVLLMLSSFRPEHEAIAKTSLASKVADYLAAGRCILVYGPEYSENVRYAQRYGFAEAVTSRVPGDLRNAILSLAHHPERLKELGERAYYFGRERHNKMINSARLWQAFFQAVDSSKRLQ